MEKENKFIVYYDIDCKCIRVVVLDNKLEILEAIELMKEIQIAVNKWEKDK